MLAVYVKLMLDGADRVPMLAIEQRLTEQLEGHSVAVRDEDGSTTSVVIDSIEIGDFTVEVD